VTALSTATTTSAAREGSGAMFDGIAPRYDFVNRVISLGLDRRWRRKLIDALALGEEARVLDVATGTADVAIAVARRHADAQVVGIDPAEGMLAVGRRKVTHEGLDGRVELRQGDAQDMSDLDDASFDASCIAFGIRNVPDRARGLAEMARVTRPGGRMAVLELGEPRSGLLARIVRFQIHVVTPRIGAWLSGKREYAYLARSIAAFPPPGEFAALMASTGLRVLSITPLGFGAAHLYVAER
jgi:demethylmenaquinone methyltransferase / 2-methoxy-6-polyprenyl-1,4-benzoquinol methylase